MSVMSEIDAAARAAEEVLSVRTEDPAIWYVGMLNDLAPAFVIHAIALAEDPLTWIPRIIAGPFSDLKRADWLAAQFNKIAQYGEEPREPTWAEQTAAMNSPEPTPEQLASGRPTSDAVQYPSLLPCINCGRTTDHNVSPYCDRCEPLDLAPATGLRLSWLQLQLAVVNMLLWMVEPRYRYAREAVYNAWCLPDEPADRVSVADVAGPDDPFDDEIPF